MSILNRFQAAQRVGAKKEKESLERTRSVSYRNQSIYESNGNDHFAPTPTQYQQQVVLSMEQDVDVNGLRERDEQLRELDVNLFF